MLDSITPVILTFNEEANIARTLSALTWARSVLVVDSFSSDRTIEICAQFGNTRIVQHEFESHAAQANFALSQDIETEWVLSMDADYVLTPELVTELAELQPEPQICGMRAQFEYLIGGRQLRGSLYPPRTVLYRQTAARYIQDGHTQKVEIEGGIRSLRAKIQHDDRKPTARWLRSQWSYARLEAAKLHVTPWQQLSVPDKLRKIGLAPVVIVPYTLIIKGTILSGWVGLIYAAQRLVAELYLQWARVVRTS